MSSNTSTHPILGNLALGYAPMIDAQRQVLATRLTLMPLRPDARLPAAELKAAIDEAWPTGTAVISVLNEALLDGLLADPPAKHLMLEVPAFMVADHAQALLDLRRAGHTLLLKGRPLQALAPELQACFKYQMLELDDDRQQPLPPGPAKLLTGMRGAEAVDEAFKRGASAVLGWSVSDEPLEAAAGAARSEVQADLQVIVQLMSQVDQGEDIDKLEATLKRDPSLAFKLLRYMNSAAFGLSVEVSSFRHAIMLLGMARLKRWLALLLTTASKDHALRPVMYGALRRGLLMEELAQSMDDREMRDEMFICGLFSLLDHMLKQPFARLLQSIPVPERVRQALVEGSGPYRPYLDLVRAIEAESGFDYRHAAEQLMLGAEEINHAVLRALAKAGQLE
ncbi:HDOD domain-containing protein [Kinneretia asaccharophila]|uniref:EAL and modified HD-GYP domain-containing signal transduction protein n=1 Tax=Roseateles asaccharophilus TaxID=582607 RepID=A0A4R6MRT3_9BURK|nr:HDOD domain-containing protein [Roseateles asaccharophilus]MDN3546544.1 HDOD domain-containing protein [Roseateles asaccharophilus]TDP05034.1 EAL and modified HD-GYP domain-containing signal transduction protein [Roseateles asaccharophilus]